VRNSSPLRFIHQPIFRRARVYRVYSCTTFGGRTSPATRATRATVLSQPCCKFSRRRLVGVASHIFPPFCRYRGLHSIRGSHNASMPLYHATNLALHAAATTLAYFSCTAITRISAPLSRHSSIHPVSFSFVAAALFAVHPVHTEAVVNIVRPLRLHSFSALQRLCPHLYPTSSSSSSTTTTSSSSSTHHHHASGWSGRAPLRCSSAPSVHLLLPSLQSPRS
jgi:hypothetical protein